MVEPNNKPRHPYCVPVGSGLPFEEEHPNGRCKYADPTGGVLMVDIENVAYKVVKEMFQKIGASLLTGKLGNLKGISTPANVHSNRTYLDTLPFEACLMEHYVRRCMNEAKSPIEKMQYIVAYKLGNCFVGITQSGTRQPLNPILGETSVFTSESGTKIYGEQTSHHPPVSNFHTIGPEDCKFQSYGHWEYNVQLYKTMQGLTFTQPGKQTLILPDETIYDMQAPSGEVTGIMTTQKKFTFSGHLIITDLVNGLEAKVYFDVNEPKRRGYMGGWVGGGHGKLKGKISENREDLVTIKISTLPAKSDEDVVSIGTGSYLENISFDGKPPIWDINMQGIKTNFKKPTEGEEAKLLLISDSACRQDAIAITEKNWEVAEKVKHEMEELQRHDAKLRSGPQSSQSPATSPTFKNSK